MVLKLDYCVNILKDLYSGINFIFLFDHFCGHDRGRKVGSNVTKMNIGYGVAQQEMHPTKIDQNFGYPGLNEKIL